MFCQQSKKSLDPYRSPIQTKQDTACISSPGLWGQRWGGSVQNAFTITENSALSISLHTGPTSHPRPAGPYAELIYLFYSLYTLRL